MKSAWRSAGWILQRKKNQPRRSQGSRVRETQTSVQTFRIGTPSDEPTKKEGDHCLLNGKAYLLNRFLDPFQRLPVVIVGKFNNYWLDKLTIPGKIT